MNIPTLSTTSAIVHYLSIQGKDNGFNDRKKLYNDAGLKEKLGDYIGSASQNNHLLNYLRNKHSSPSSDLLNQYSNQ